MKSIVSIICILFFAGLLHAQDNAADKIRHSKSFLHEKAKAYKMTLRLSTIHVQKDTLWFGLTLHNYSRLSYPIDFLRLYIKDKKQGKRTSVQELEIIPIYKDSLNNVAAKRTERFVIAVAKFTIPDKKKLIVEIFETNGGRNLSLEITNSDLFKSKKLQ